MKIYVFIIIIAVSNSHSAVGQTYDIIDGETVNYTDENGLKQGRWIDYFGDNVTPAESSERGWISSIVHFKDDVRHGYYESDNQWFGKTFGYYHEGKKDGPWREGGEGFVLDITYREGVRHGPFFEYDLAEVLYQKGHYIDGQQHGLWENYDGEGNVQSTQIFDHGTLYVINTFDSGGLLETTELVRDRALHNEVDMSAYGISLDESELLLDSLPAGIVEVHYDDESGFHRFLYCEAGEREIRIQMEEYMPPQLYQFLGQSAYLNTIIGARTNGNEIEIFFDDPHSRPRAIDTISLQQDPQIPGLWMTHDGAYYIEGEYLDELPVVEEEDCFFDY